MYRHAIALLLLIAALGCGSGNPIGGGNGDKNRNADVNLDLGAAGTLRDRVITLNGSVLPSSLTGDAAGVTERYRLRLFYSTDGTAFSNATILTPGGAVAEQTFPVGVTTPITIGWDRDADIGVDVQARIFLKLEVDQVDHGTGTGSITRGPKELDTRATAPCTAKTPRLSQDTVVLTRNQPSAAQIPVEFGQAPMSFTINEPLSGGLQFNTDGSITGTPTVPLSLVRLVRVSDGCSGRSDQAWITITVQ